MKGSERPGVPRQLRAILPLPAMVTLVIPALILWLTGSLKTGWHLPMPWRALPIAAGALLICLGLVLLVWTIHLFATMGEGTLAPWDPTQRLVIHGIYRHVRHPMITGVCCILLGEAVIFGSLVLLGWFTVFLVVNLIYIPLVEERGLQERFGEEYASYRAAVPGWIPRWKPWDRNGHEANSILTDG